MAADAITTALAEAIRPILREEIRRALREQQQADVDAEQRLAPKAAAKLVRCRAADVYAAVESGELPAEQSQRGGRRSWLVTAADASAWAANRRASA